MSESKSLTVADLQAAYERVLSATREPHIHLVNPTAARTGRAVCVECGALVDTSGWRG